ncbi:hypothetical protein [Oceanobacillus halotolerans]|uniref:hypothetical protein n=1 Tax=Oceanobacillus halotolerans TaxID=2663380 RepID=UPI0013DB1575|nr:hypothetical protein [Oceanobacillus halotolerans]
MRLPSIFWILGLCIFIIVLTAINLKPEEDILNEAKDIAEQTFSEPSNIETNHKIDAFSFYLPSYLKVVEEDEHNVILQNEEQTYIVFFNRLESPLSEVNYQAAKTEESVVYHSFEDDSKFGYIRILPNSNDYELQIGVGGVKITTYTTKENIRREVKELMKMARSIVETSENDFDADTD